MLLAAGVILLMTAGPTLAQQDRQPVIDLTDFITVDDVGLWADRNADGIPDIPVEGAEGDIPVGIAGIWDDAIGALTPDEFLIRVDPTGTGFDLGEEGAFLLGPCGGAVISYDAHGDSLDAAVDLGDGNPPVDVYGDPAFTAGNPFQVDSGGTVLYFGFTLPDAGLSGDAFHDHRWEVVIMGVSADNGGDPNPNDKNRNAGIMELGDFLPFQFQAKLKAQGVFVDGWGDNACPPTPPTMSRPCSPATPSASVKAGCSSWGTRTPCSPPPEHWHRPWPWPASPASCSTPGPHCPGGPDHGTDTAETASVARRHLGPDPGPRRVRLPHLRLAGDRPRRCERRWPSREPWWWAA